MPRLTLPWSAYLARNVRAERHRLRLTQAQLAARVNTEAERAKLPLDPLWTNGTAYEVEAGTRMIKIDELPPLCRALEVTLTELAKGSLVIDLRALGV